MNKENQNEKRVVNNQSNLEKLKEMVSRAKREIKICSPWIRSGMLYEVLEHRKNDIKNGNLKLKVITRLGSRDDINISGIDLFRRLKELNADVKYHPTVHTKMYIVDDSEAIVGSFNLTGGGFGTESNPGNNLESGVYIDEKQNPEVIEGLVEEFDRIWEDAQEIDDKLVGFVLNFSNSNEFYFMATKEMQSGTFVSVPVKVEGKEYAIIGQVREVYKTSSGFFEAPREGFLDEKVKNVFDVGGDYQKLISGLAESYQAKEHNLHWASVQIRFLYEKTRNKKITNRYAPEAGAAVLMPNEEDLKNIFQGKEKDFSSDIMCLASNPEVKISLNLKKIIDQPQHMAVFGTTGSGKSYFVKRFIRNDIQAYLKQLKNKQDDGFRVVIIDPHGEYGDLKDDISSDFFSELKLDNLKTTVSNVDKLTEICQLDSLTKEQKTFIKEKLTKSKTVEEFIYALKKNNIESLDLKITYDEFLSKEELEGIFFAEFKELLDFAGNLEKIKKNKDSVKFLEKIDMSKKLIERIAENNVSFKEQFEDVKIKYVEKIFEDLFKKIKSLQESNILPDYIITKIAEHRDLFRLPGDEKPDIIELLKAPKIYWLKMNDIHEDYSRWEMAGQVMQAVFNRSKETGGKFKTLFVLEEAHNFAPEKGSKKENLSLRITQKIASEGRKFGVGLLVVTQRPAYVAKDVLAQCNTQAIFRLINNQDLGSIQETVEGISKEELIRLPHYQQGQCVLTGVAVEEPVVVQVAEEDKPENCL